MSDLRHGPAHPLALAATALLLLNDHVLKPGAPSWVTGKLSDVAWLVVAPVVVAAVLAWLGVGERTGRRVALGGVAVVFVALQVWAPLGDTWVAWTGGAHVADVEDLLALPALLLVPLCWRGGARRRLTAVALPVSVFACLATKSPNCAVGRLPVDGEAAWDPTRPLGLGFGLFGSTRHDTAGVLTAITLTADDGEVVELVGATDSNAVWLCPIGGLRPDTTYTWEVRPFASDSPNHAPTEETSTGTSTFHTAAAGDFEPATSDRECMRLVDDVGSGRICGDTGYGYGYDTADTAVPPDTDTDTDTDTDG